MQLSKDKLIDAYTRMKKIRVFEETMRDEFAKGTVPAFIHLYIGQEAIASGICVELNDDDTIASTHRGHGHCLAKNSNLERMTMEIFCRADGLCEGKGGSMHIADLSVGMLGANAIVGANAPIAVGAALRQRVMGENLVSAAFIGDGASNQGAVFEAMNLASVLKLPVLFVFENNGYAEFTGVDYHCGGGDIAGRAEGFGMPSYKLDGSDFFAVQEAAAEAVQRARKGDGPSAIECYAKRWYGHFEGDPQHYRTKKELESIRKNNDPLIIFRQKVEEAGLIESSELDLIDDDLLSQVTNAVEKAKNSPLPNVEELTTNVYEKGSY
ncbi:MAG: thiamine pyrophosphate-dependent dehydrogenase E1 component subunit alpha [Pseudomonadota bacterium]|nr:thiamine pyrophosphate-dependent dehydrogenase E1 component subunit alpha [Pseudomonadota bacterium]MEC7958416.1 thiamine pyrophosphate-dependent dehydrogenase E1 component subunit alpha [Pseudomonadota bacterium]MEC8020208.1 thiamine pyrophosphate-dependent dehydrogenase E1 component subunit alpha [Pseudomonadota bacterium]MEC8498011.1 thiamine pyrophosphate-dependent dehydrogenase E1 component subunit alpha [Pseudomonadota bacterium]